MGPPGKPGPAVQPDAPAVEYMSICVCIHKISDPEVLVSRRAGAFGFYLLQVPFPPGFTLAGFLPML